MSTPAPLNSEQLRTIDRSQVGNLAMSEIRELMSFSVRGLAGMFDQNANLFCHRLVRNDDGLLREGISHRYTIMTLLGLTELEAAGVDHTFDIQAIYASLIRNTAWVRGVGDLGLLI